ARLIISCDCPETLCDIVSAPISSPATPRSFYFRRPDLLRRGADRLHSQTFARDVATIRSHQIALLDAVQDFNAGAVGAADADRADAHFVFAQDGDGSSLGADDQRVARNQERRVFPSADQIHTRVHAG